MRIVNSSSGDSSQSSIWFPGSVCPGNYWNFDERYLSGASGITGIRLANYGSVGSDGVRDSQQVVLTGIYDTNGWDNPTTQEFRQIQFEIAGQWYNAPYV